MQVFATKYWKKKKVFSNHLSTISLISFKRYPFMHLSELHLSLTQHCLPLKSTKLCLLYLDWRGMFFSFLSSSCESLKYLTNFGFAKTLCRGSGHSFVVVTLRCQCTVTRRILSLLQAEEPHYWCGCHHINGSFRLYDFFVMML